MSRNRRAKAIKPARGAIDIAEPRRVLLAAVVVLALVVCGSWLVYLRLTSGVGEGVTTGSLSDNARSPVASDSVGGFQPTIENPSTASGPAPKGMVWIPGGELSVGANDLPGMDSVGMNATEDARPIHRVLAGSIEPTQPKRGRA